MTINVRIGVLPFHTSVYVTQDKAPRRCDENQQAEKIEPMQRIHVLLERLIEPCFETGHCCIPFLLIVRGRCVASVTDLHRPRVSPTPERN